MRVKDIGFEAYAMLNDTPMSCVVNDTFTVDRNNPPTIELLTPPDETVIDITTEEIEVEFTWDGDDLDFDFLEYLFHIAPIDVYDSITPTLY